MNKMKYNLTKEEAYEIATSNIGKDKLIQNKVDDVDKYVSFHESFERVEGSAWAVTVSNPKIGNYKKGRESAYRATYIISDQTKQVERIIDKKVIYLNDDLNSNKLNLTKEGAFCIAQNYVEKQKIQYNPIYDVDEHITFYTAFDNIDGSAWLITYRYKLPWGEPAEDIYVISDKTKQIVYIQHENGITYISNLGDDSPPLIERLKEVFETGTIDERVSLIEDVQWDFQASYDDEDVDQNIEDFDEIMEILINYVTENKESEIIKNVLDVIIDAQELQDTKGIEFSIFAQNLHTVTGEILLLYIDILANTNDPSYTPYLLSLKNHKSSEVSSKLKNIFQKSIFKPYSK